MAEAVMSSAIESLKCWLLKKEESNLEKLYSLIVGMLDLGEENEKMVHSLLLQIGKEEDDEEERERNIKKLYNLMDLNNKKMQSLVVGMADFWENHKGKLYLLMFLVDTYDLWGGDVGELKNEKLHRLLIEITDVWGGDEGEPNMENLHSLSVEITDLWGDYKRELKKEKLHRLLVEITDLWEDDKGGLKKISTNLWDFDKRKLHRLLVEKIDMYWGDDEGELNKENLHSSLFLMLKKENYSKIICRMSGEVARLWKDKQPKLNKEKLYTWLANKLDLSEPEYLFSVLHNVVLLYDSIRKGVEGAKRGFIMILDKKSGDESSLRYFISDVVDMAHHAHYLIQLEDSDPFALFFKLSVLQALEHQSYYKWFADEFMHIANRLQEIKVKVEKVGSNMAEAVILWAIKSLECWLRKKGGLVEENLEKVYSLIIGMSDLGKEKKEIVHGLLLQFRMEDFKYEGVRDFEKAYSLIVGMSDLGEEKKKEMVHGLLLHFGMEMTEHKWGRNLENLYSLIVGMSDLGEEKKKEMLHTLRLQFMEKIMDEGNLEKMSSLIVGMSNLGEEKKKEMMNTLRTEGRLRKEETVHVLYKLLDLNKEKMKSLVVGMADFWEDNNEKLYSLLFLVAVFQEDDEGKLYSLFGGWGHWRKLNKEKLQSLLVEITDLWGDDEGELDKEKLHSLLFQMQDWDNYSKKKMMCRMSEEVAGLWKDKQPKLNKEKLYAWLANKMDLCEPENLFAVLLHASSYFHKEIREGVEGAKGEFRMILDLITDKKLGEETSLRYFISDVVDMAHHAHFLIHLKDSDPFALFFEISFLRDPQGHENDYPIWLGKKFKHIVKGLQEIKDSMLGSGVERLQNVREMEGGENVVGLEEDVKSLLLCNKTITLIKGMAGIGKTTLARQLYNHTTIAQQFQRRAWVCLSRVVDSRKEILVSLIRQLVDSNELAILEKIEHADFKSLKQMLRQQLLIDRCFIVLDGVWDNRTHLQYIMKALPSRVGYSSKDINGSRLLLTTRSTSINYNFGVSHMMKFMDDDKSWKLLLKTLSIEGSDENFPKPLVQNMRQILRRNCNGLPLAIKEVGRHWAKKRQSGGEWEELIQSIDLSETIRALESSYDNWDPELKVYFLHLAFFKEGATIRVKRLVHIWQVMGLNHWAVQSGLKELLNESVVDATDVGYDKQSYIPNIKTYSIHAIFHMLSIRKAEDELNFEILNKDGNHRPSHEPHHRVIYCSREKLMNYSSNDQDKHLVSLFFYGGGYFKASDPSYWKHFEQLKILDMEDFGLKILPDAIGMLSELRYLGLRNNYIKEIPDSLSRLKKLEVLDIALNFMVEVKDIIWEMKSLRHLYMSNISCWKPLRIYTLENLMTWTYVSVHNWRYEVSRLEMMSLTKLGIHEVDENTNISKLFASLTELRFLKFLILRGFRFKSMPSLDDIGILRNLRELKLEGLITRLPSANNFPEQIKCLSLVNSCLHEDPMPILEKLTFLKYLKLQNAYTGQQMVISGNGFSKLESLVIEELWHLTNVQIEKGAMEWLKDLEINNCPNLETLPKDYIPSSSRIMFKMKTTKKNATKIRESSFVSRVREVGEVDIQP